jgi:hypothetical protein
VFELSDIIGDLVASTVRVSLDYAKPVSSSTLLPYAESNETVPTRSIPWEPGRGLGIHSLGPNEFGEQFSNGHRLFS